MSSPSVEVPVDEVVVSLPRRRGPKSYSVHNGVARIPGPAEAVAAAARPRARLKQHTPHPADVAQSVLFESLLLTEIDDLEDRASAVERRRQRRSTRSIDGAETLSHELRQLRQRINEAQRLLDALRERFPLD